MKILIIPSWYPYPENPLAGKFFVDQAKALAKHSAHEFLILNFGQNQYQLRIRKPLHSLAVLKRIKTDQAKRRKISSSLEEITLPRLTWTSRIASGNLANVSLPDDVRPDLIYAQVSYPGGYVAMKIGEQLDIPYIIAEHSGPFPLPEFLQFGKLSAKVTEPISKAKELIAVSSVLQKQIQDTCGRKAIVIPNMVDTEFFAPSATARQDGPIKLFSMSAFTKDKGVEDLLEALYIIWHRKVRFEMVWAGDGPLLKQIKKKAGKLPIRFAGVQNKMQVRTQFQACDIYVMPSRVESFSMVLIEAMSCGKPAVATMCGGPSDIINSKTGILCEANNPGALAGAIYTCMTNLKDYNEKTIRNNCLSHYDSKVVAQQILSVLEESISS